MRSDEGSAVAGKYSLDPIPSVHAHNYHAFLFLLCFPIIRTDLLQTCARCSTQDDCGDYVSALCPYGDQGCPDNEGDYDVVFPEPGHDTSSRARYSVRVGTADDPTMYNCSSKFYLMASEDAPQVGDADGPSLEIMSPVEDDVVSVGEVLTVKVKGVFYIYSGV